MKVWLTKSWHPWIQVSAGRVFAVRYPPDHTFEQTVSLFTAIEAISATADDDYGFIIDFGPLARSDARGRAFVSESEKRINAMTSVQLHCRGVALVVHNAFQRGVLTAISWFAKRSYECHVAPSFEQAEAWIQDRMKGGRVRKAR